LEFCSRKIFWKNGISLAPHLRWSVFFQPQISQIFTN
jgi:hypothetical protein